MKVILAILFLALAAAAYGQTLEQQWSDYKRQFERNYTPEEDAARFAIFSRRVTDINAHNEKFNKGEVSFSQGVNHFTDLTDEELAKRTGGLRKGGLKARPKSHA